MPSLTLEARTAEVAVTEERTRLARELHDTVAQTLYSISIGASRVLTLLERSETAHVHDIVQDLLQQASAGQTELRVLLQDLRSNDQAQVPGGLTGALASLATLVRITREALHNIAKHARATHVDLMHEVGPTEVILQVADDGRGFDPWDVYPGHFGLELMREHATATGGAIEVVSASG